MLFTSVGEKMELDNLPPQLQNQIAQFQQLQQQAQMIISQRQQMELQQKEVHNTIEELENIDDKTTIYKSIGSLLAKANNKETVVKELQEQKETLDIRVKTLQRQEERLRTRLNELQEQLSQKLQGLGG